MFGSHAVAKQSDASRALIGMKFLAWTAILKSMCGSLAHGNVSFCVLILQQRMGVPPSTKVHVRLPIASASCGYLVSDTSLSLSLHRTFPPHITDENTSASTDTNRILCPSASISEERTAFGTTPQLAVTCSAERKHSSF